MKRLGMAVGAVLLVAACSESPAGPAAAELALAQEAEGLVVQAVATVHGNYVGWLERLIGTLRTTDDPEARAFLEEAQRNREAALQARREGRFEEARRYHELAFRAVLAAVIDVYPDAPVRAGVLVDEAVARIEQRLGDREAPRIRRILAHVKELRELAQASEDPVTELALNLRCVQILHRLVHHVRFVQAHEHDRVADGEMQGTPVPGR